MSSRIGQSHFVFHCVSEQTRSVYILCHPGQTRLQCLTMDTQQRDISWGLQIILRDKRNLTKWSALSAHCCQLQVSVLYSFELIIQSHRATQARACCHDRVLGRRPVFAHIITRVPPKETTIVIQRYRRSLCSNSRAGESPNGRFDHETMNLPLPPE